MATKRDVIKFLFAAMVKSSQYAKNQVAKSDVSPKAMNRADGSIASCKKLGTLLLEMVDEGYELPSTVLVLAGHLKVVSDFMEDIERGDPDEVLKGLEAAFKEFEDGLRARGEGGVK